MGFEAFIAVVCEMCAEEAVVVVAEAAITDIAIEAAADVAIAAAIDAAGAAVVDTVAAAAVESFGAAAADMFTGALAESVTAGIADGVGAGIAEGVGTGLAEGAAEGIGAGMVDAAGTGVADAAAGEAVATSSNGLIGDAMATGGTEGAAAESGMVDLSMPVSEGAANGAVVDPSLAVDGAANASDGTMSFDSFSGKQVPMGESSGMQGSVNTALNPTGEPYANMPANGSVTDPTSNLAKWGNKAYDFAVSQGGSGLIGGIVKGVGQGMAADQQHQWQMDALSRAKANLSSPVVMAGPGRNLPFAKPRFQG